MDCVIPKGGCNFAHEQDCFDRGASKIAFANAYDLVSLRVGGGGTNDVTTAISKNTLITGGAINNIEGTRIIQTIVTRIREFTAEIQVEFPSVADIKFLFGYYLDATNYVFIELDTDADPDWRLILNDNTGEQIATLELGPVLADTVYVLRLAVDQDGTPHWWIAAGDYSLRELPSDAITKKMVAGAHYCQYSLEALVGAAKTAEIDYLETLKLKAH